MPSELANLIAQLKPDPWRREVGFSGELEQANKSLFDPTQSAEAVLGNWLQKYQPCIFGRVAAKLNLVRYCFLRESDLISDDAVRDLIQEARRSWTDEALDGRASAFIILLISEHIASAVPDEVTARLAMRLCSLYLRDAEIAQDQIFHERVWLEKPGSHRVTWEWLAGVNYFCAQADRRWWQDHRIPGGMGFSVNSVGHLVKSAIITKMGKQLNDALGVGEEGEFGGGAIGSLDDALVYAMRTIANASKAASGPATELLPVAADDGVLPACPVKLPPVLAGKNHCAYSGWYHTDYTIPSDYFRPAVERPGDVEKQALDFTYLFWSSVENAAHETMGPGRRIRTDGFGEENATAAEKQSRMVAVEVNVNDRERLKVLPRFR